MELNYQNGGDQKVKISPIGNVIGIDGRAFKIDGQKVISATIANGLDLPIDVNHGYAEAAGWAPRESLEVRADGIYANIDFTKIGSKLVGEKLYRYLSPVYVLDYNTREVQYIESVGLVNVPNVLNNALNNQEEKQGEKVGDTKETNAAEASAVEAQKQELERLREANKKLRENVIDAHIKNGSLLPAQRDFALKLPEELQAEFLELNKVDTKRLKEETSIEKNNAETSPEQQQIFELLGLTEETK